MTDIFNIKRFAANEPFRGYCVLKQTVVRKIGQHICIMDITLRFPRKIPLSIFSFVLFLHARKKSPEVFIFLSMTCSSSMYFSTCASSKKGMKNFIEKTTCFPNYFVWSVGWCLPYGVAANTALD